MHFIKLLVLGWMSFGVLTLFGFLWLCARTVRAVDQPAKTRPSFDQRAKAAAVASSKVA